MITEKYCGRRRHTVPIAKFGKSSVTRDGYQAWCRDCKSEYYKDHVVRKWAEYSARALDWSKA